MYRIINVPSGIYARQVPELLSGIETAEGEIHALDTFTSEGIPVIYAESLEDLDVFGINPSDVTVVDCEEADDV